MERNCRKRYQYLITVNDIAPEFTSELLSVQLKTKKLLELLLATDADGDDVALTISGEELRNYFRRRSNFCNDS